MAIAGGYCFFICAATDRGFSIKIGWNSTAPISVQISDNASN